MVGMEDRETMEEKQRLVPVEIQAAICIRPLLKKERDDTVVLEAQQQQQAAHHQAEEKGQGVALHPLPPKINGDSIAPSAALVLQTMSPDTIQTGHDEEFRFDYVFSTDARDLLQQSFNNTSQQQLLQNQVYSLLGRPMALRSMEALMSNDKIPRKTQLLLTMGSPGSGKSYICWGPGSVAKRKNSQDGLILRMVDSFFGQFHRLKHKAVGGVRHQHYALNLSVVQVNQDTYGKKYPACELHDLLQTSRASPSGSGRLVPNVKAFTRWTPRKNSASSQSSGESLDEPSIFLEQDPQTNDFHVVNRTVQTCRSLEEARDAILDALGNSRRLSSKKRYQGHVLVQMQPVVLEKTKTSSRVVRRGGMIAVLDMSGSDESDRKCNRRHRSTDSLPNRSDAHTALIHCLRTIQYNESLRVGKTPLSETLEEMDDGDDEATKMSEITCSVMTSPVPKETLARQPSFKKVPYPRHELTMLLQPLFSTTCTDETYVTLLMAASPGTRDYSEKKGLMQELESFVNARMGPAKTVTTGLQPSADLTPHYKMNGRSPGQKNTPWSAEKNGKRSSPNPPLRSEKSNGKIQEHQNHHHRPKHARQLSRHESDADDESEPKKPLNVRSRGLHPTPSPKKVVPGVFCDRKKNSGKTPVIQTAASMTYSDSSEEAEDISMPPPVAPPPPTWQPSPSARYLESPCASAPRESEVCGRMAGAEPGVHPSLSDDHEEGIPVPPASALTQEGVQHYTSTTTTTTTTTTAINGGHENNPSESYYSTSSSSAYFRPVQHTLKKVVHVGKKQCGKVWEKMYSHHTGANGGSNSTLDSDGGPSPEARFTAELESLRRKLMDSETERESLRIQVERLLHENSQLRQIEHERDALREQIQKLTNRTQDDYYTVKFEDENDVPKPLMNRPEMSREYSEDQIKKSTPRSHAYADITAPRIPFAGKSPFDQSSISDGSADRPKYAESNSFRNQKNVTPRSQAYGDITAPRLPFNYGAPFEGVEVDEIEPAQDMTNLTPRSRAYGDITAPNLPPNTKPLYESPCPTGATTMKVPLVGNSLKAHMAKLSAKSAPVPVAVSHHSPVGSPWNNW